MSDCVKKLIAEVLALDPAERDEFWEGLREHFCMKCGSKKKSGEMCWGCYESPAENYE